MNFIILSFLVFTILVALLSWYFTKQEDLESESGYFLGGRSLGATVIAGSMMLTNLSTEQLVGLNAQAFSSGFSVVAWEAGASIGIIFLALFFLPKYLGGSITTLPEFLEERYDKTTRNIVSLLFLLTLGIGFLPTVLYSGSLAMIKLFDIPGILDISVESSITLAVWAIGIIGSIYAIFGGLKAVAVSDTLNGIGLMFGGVLIPILGLAFLGDGSVSSGIKLIIENSPEKLNAIGNSDSSVPFGTAITGMRIMAIYYWCTNQAIIQRALGAKSLKEGQKGVLLTAFLKIVLGPVLLVFPGIIAYQIFGSNISGDMVYPTLVNKVLPPYLIGFFGAVLFGAVLSSFNSALNSASTIFSLNIYKPLFKPSIKEKDLIKISKLFGIVLAVISMVIAPMVSRASGGLFEFIQKIASLFNVPIALIMLVGIFSKKASALAAKVAMFFFVIVFGITQFIYPIGLHFLYTVAILFVISFILMIIVDKIKPSNKVFELKIKNEVSIEQWEYSYTVSANLMVLLFWLYTIFSKVGIVTQSGNVVMRIIIITTLYASLGVVISKYTRKYEIKRFRVNRELEAVKG